MASLDQHRGYVQKHYAEVQQYRPTEYVPKHQACGYQVLREPLWNRGKMLSLETPLAPASRLTLRPPPSSQACPLLPRSASPGT